MDPAALQFQSIAGPVQLGAVFVETVFVVVSVTVTAVSVVEVAAYAVAVVVVVEGGVEEGVGFEY